MIDEWSRIDRLRMNDMAYRIVMMQNGKHPDAESAKPVAESKKAIFDML